MCEKLESLFQQDEPLLDAKLDSLDNMHLKGAGDGYAGEVLCSKAIMSDHADRSFENPDESQTSDEYLIIDEANETQEESYLESFLEGENQELTDLDNISKDHNDHSNENKNCDTKAQDPSTQCLKKLSVQIDMSSITSVFPSLCSSLYDCKSLSSSEVSSPKQQKAKARHPGKNIPLRKSSSEIHLKPEEIYKDVGVGLQNMGNTCFVNATLQCLTYTPIFSDILLSSSDTCSVESNCIVCELTKHIKSCFLGDKKAIKPSSILKMLKGIAQHMRWGRQEDAHEFLRYLMDALHKSCMSGHQRTDSPNESMIQRIFSGELRSQVICEECGHESDTFDPFLDLCLDVKSSTSIVEALLSFVRHETLEGENSYYCARCQKNVRAKKLFTVHKPPYILTIQLKRYGMSEGKVTRHIDFPNKLDLQPYMSHGPSSKPSNPKESLHDNGDNDDGKLKKEEARVEESKPCSYNLYAVLVHDGYSTNSGHYYCYIKTKQDVWYCMNDHMVKMSSLSEVLSSEAYLLFYCQDPITYGDECPHNKPKFKMVSASSCTNLSLNSSFNTSSKVTCRGGRLRTSPTPPLAPQSEAKPIRSSSLNSSKSFSKALKHRTKTPSRYRLKRLRLSKEKLCSKRTELVRSSASQNFPCQNNNNYKAAGNDDTTQVIKVGENTPPSVKIRTITAAKKNICRQPIKQRVQQKTKFANMPESLLEILKPQKIKQTSPEEPDKPFKIPLKKPFRLPEDSEGSAKFHKSVAQDDATNEQTLKNRDSDLSSTQLQLSKGVQPAKTCTLSSSTCSPTLSPPSTTPSKTTIQLRPRKSRSVVASPTSSSSPGLETAPSPSSLCSSTHAQSPIKTHSAGPNIEHRKFRKRKQNDRESPLKCPTQGRSLRKTSRMPSNSSQFVVAPIKLRKVAVTEDGEHLYRIV